MISKLEKQMHEMHTKASHSYLKRKLENRHTKARQSDLKRKLQNILKSKALPSIDSTRTIHSEVVWRNLLIASLMAANVPASLQLTDGT